MTRKDEITIASCAYGSRGSSIDFEAGAKWADANPKQDLADLSRRWHSIYETPSGEKPIIYETKNYKFGVLNNIKPSNWDWYANDKYSIMIWAYAEDLLQKGGEA